MTTPFLRIILIVSEYFNWPYDSFYFPTIILCVIYKDKLLNLYCQKNPSFHFELDFVNYNVIINV